MKVHVTNHAMQRARQRFPRWRGLSDAALVRLLEWQAGEAFMNALRENGARLVPRGPANEKTEPDPDLPVYRVRCKDVVYAFKGQYLTSVWKHKRARRSHEHDD